MLFTTKQLKSTQILDDCQRSLDLLDTVQAKDKQLFRILWTYCMHALRNVEEVLLKYDARQYPIVLTSWGKRHAGLEVLKQQYNELTPYDKCDSDDYLVYHRLIHNEGNSYLYDVTPPYVDELWVSVGQMPPVNWDNTYLPMADSDKWGGDDCRDWIQRGIDWWRKELDTLVRGTEQPSKGALVFPDSASEVGGPTIG